MRVMVFFDLPVQTAVQRHNYSTFRKALIREGFFMLQESVYVRIATTRQSAEFIENRVAELCPREGIVQSLMITEKQYASIRFLTGKQTHDDRDNDQGTVII
jgi:CRISPR-associated protein Cas2